MAKVDLTAVVPSTLDVITKYKDLLDMSMGSDSAYIRVKETLQDLLDNGNISPAERGKLIGDALGSLHSSVVNSSMSTALQWAANESEILLKREEMAYQLALLTQDETLRLRQIDKIKEDIAASSSQRIRMHGAPTTQDATTGAVTGLTDAGKVWTDMQLVTAQTATETGYKQPLLTAQTTQTNNQASLITQQESNALAEHAVIVSKEKESQAAIHKVIADTYVNNGSYTYTVGASGVSAVTSTTDPGFLPTYTYQQTIAEEQAKGYAYNAWANALTSTSTMLSAAIASDQITGTTFDTIASNITGTWTTTLGNLSGVTGPA